MIQSARTGLRFLKRVQIAGRLARTVSARVRHLEIRTMARQWVQVEKGLAGGLWLYLSPMDEEKYRLGHHEPRLQEAFQKFALPGRVVYDVGAHIGFFSLAAARLVGPQGKVLAFEPDPDNVDRLMQHAARNNLKGRLQIIPAAVWSCTSSGGIPFRRGQTRRSHGGISNGENIPPLADGEMMAVPALSLDDLVQTGHPIPDVIKVDVEGGEREVLKGGEQLFSKSSPVLLCEIHEEKSVRWICDWLAQRAYAVEWLTTQSALPCVLLAKRLCAAENPAASLYRGRI